MTVPVWPLAWQVAVGLGCAAAGCAITLSGRARATGCLLVVAALSLGAGPLIAVAGQPGLARGLTLSAIPLALLRVVAVARVTATRSMDTALTVAGLATAASGAAGQAAAGPEGAA